MKPHNAIANAERIPDGFVAIGPAVHPTKDVSGLLVRNRHTGVYVLLGGGVSMGVPHKWAADTAAEIGKGPDLIQDACVVRMAELGLNPRQVWTAMGGEASPVSYNHVNDYLTRRSSIGSHKLQHVLAALKLVVTSA